MKREARVGLGILLGAVILSALLIGMALKQQPAKPVVIPDEAPGTSVPTGDGRTGSAPARGTALSPEGLPDVPAAGSTPGTLSAGARPNGGGSETFGLSGNVPVGDEPGGAAPDSGEAAPRTGGTDESRQEGGSGAGRTDAPRPGPGASGGTPSGRGQGSGGPDEGGPAPGRDFTYTVQSGDSPWKIAERFYGSGSEWKRIAQANPGLKSDALRAGTKLVIPGKAGTGTSGPEPRPGGTQPAGAGQGAETGAAPQGGEAAGTPRVHRIAAGDSLYRLAEKYLGSGSRYGEIAKLNPGLDPANLKVGQEIKLPAR